MVDEVEKYKNILLFKENEIKILKDELAIYKNIISVFPGIILILNKYGNIEFINENGIKILRYSSKNELIGQNWFNKCIPENIREKIKFIFEKIVEGYIEEYELYENPVETKIKTQKMIKWFNNYIRDEKGNIIKVISYGIETYNRPIEEGKIQEMTKIFDFLPEAIHIIDRDYKILYFNEVFKKWNMIIGFTTNVLGKNLFDIFSFLSPNVKEEYEKVFNNGEILITKEKHVILGKEILTETRKIPIFEKDKVVKIITFIREITNFLR